MRHAGGRIASRAQYGVTEDYDGRLERKLPHEMQTSDFYAELSSVGLEYGPSFQCVSSVEYEGRHATVQLEAKERLGTSNSILDAAMLDSAFQVLVKLLFMSQESDGAQQNKVDHHSAWLPVKAGTMVVYDKVGLTAQATVHLQSVGRTQAIGDIRIFSSSGKLLVHVSDLLCSPIPKDEKTEQKSAFLARMFSVRWKRVAARSASEDTTTDVDLTSCSITSATGRRVACFLPQTTSLEVFGACFDCELVASPSEVILNLTKAVTDVLSQPQKKLIVVTTHAVAVEVSDVHVDPVQAAVWGFCRSLNVEHPELNTQVIDIEGLPLPEDLGKLITMVQSHEHQYAVFRDGTQRIYIPRLCHYIDNADLNNSPESQTSVVHVPVTEVEAELVVSRLGDLSSLRYTPIPATPCIPDDHVQVRVFFSSVNFKDILKVLGQLKAAAMVGTYTESSIGIDCAGVVTAVGSNVQRLKVGERVAMIGTKSQLASTVCEPEKVVMPVPSSISLQAASCLLAYTTSYYSLIFEGRLRRGETILIHSASGGVGLVAVQVAKLLGARVIATAGTPEKRKYLQEEVGLEDVFDSRSLNWSSEVLRATGGKGVDMILSAQSGEAIEVGLESLAVGGRFLEIGKNDIVSGRRMTMASFSKSISYHAIDIDTLLADPRGIHTVQEHFVEVLKLFEKGELVSIPITMFQPQEIQEAYSFLSSGKCTGKVVIDWRDGSFPMERSVAPAVIRNDRSYIITGGLSGFGIDVAEWLASVGAGEVILLSRSGTCHNSDDQRRLEGLQSLVKVSTRPLDVSDADAVAIFFEDAKITSPYLPFGGIFHAAVVYQDKDVTEVSVEDIDKGMRAKVLGAMNLDVATSEIPTLDHFVMFSSVSSIFGNANQTIYSAANAFLEGLAQRRHQEGRPGLALALGALETGEVAKNAAVREHLISIGIPPTPVPAVLKALQMMLSRSVMNTSSQVLVGDFDFVRWAESWKGSKFSHLNSLIETAQSTQVRGNEKSDYEIFCRKLASDPDTAIDRVTELLKVLVAPLIRTDKTDIDTSESLRDLGVDSLLAVQYAIKIEARTGIKLSIMRIISSEGLEALAGLVCNDAFERDAQTGNKTDGHSLEEEQTKLVLSLRARVLVSAPYNNVTDERQLGPDTVEAMAVPDRFSLGCPLAESTSQASLAELARHMAIVGSYALSLHHGLRGQQTCYPIASSTLTSPVKTGLPLDKYRVVGRMESINLLKNQGVAVSEAFNTCTGELIASLRTEYNVIPVSDFLKLMTVSGASPEEIPNRTSHQGSSFQNTPAAKLLAHSNDSSSANSNGKHGIAATVTLLDSVDREFCVGHFDAVPAFPVSLLVRYVMEVIGYGIQRRDDFPATEHTIPPATATSSMRVLWGKLTAHRFLLAGEKNVRFVASQDGEKRGSIGSEIWNCAVFSDSGEPPAVTIQLEIEIACTSTSVSSTDNAEEKGKTNK